MHIGNLKKKKLKKIRVSFQYVHLTFILGRQFI